MGERRRWCVAAGNAALLTFSPAPAATDVRVVTRKCVAAPAFTAITGEPETAPHQTPGTRQTLYRRLPWSAEPLEGGPVATTPGGSRPAPPSG